MNCLTVLKNHSAYIEEYVILDGTNNMYKYTLSNNLDDIRTSIFARTGYNINLNKATWSINNNLSISVKHLMNTHHVKFSMTTDTKRSEKSKFVEINMRAGDLWLITGFDERNNHMFSWDLIKTCKMILRFLESENSLDSDDE